MSNFIQIFNWEGHHVRTFIDDYGEPWFAVVDVCRVLGHTNVSMAVKRLDDDEKRLFDPKDFLGSGSNKPLWGINQSGLYSLILTSSLPEAKRFKKWVTSDLLPTLRRTGQYFLTQPTVELPPVVNPYTGEFLSVCGDEDSALKETRIGFVETLSKLGFRAPCYKQQVTNNVSRILIGVPIKPFRRAFLIPKGRRTRLYMDLNHRRAWNQVEDLACTALLRLKPINFGRVEEVVYDTARTVKHLYELRGVDLTENVPQLIEALS